MIKKHLNYIIGLFVVCLSPFTLFSQNDSLDLPVQVKVVARALPGKIILRWAPTSPMAWQLANKYGYTIERVTMTRKNKLIKDRSIKVLTSSPIKVYTEDQWEKVVLDQNGNIDKYAAIAVQAIYGSSFVLTEDYSNSFTKVIEKAEENEKRYTFALFSADQSLKVAQAMGLMYSDNEVVEDEKYLYRVYANVPLELMAIDTGFVYTGPADYGELTKPIEFAATFDDHEATLTWNRELFEQIYSSYQVERSDNGKDFYPLGDLPFINTVPTEEPNPRLMYRVDSLPENNKVYYYRVKGRTVFDEFGPWSDTVSGQAIDALKSRPIIKMSEVIDNKKIKVQWDFPIENEADIEYFSVYRADKDNGQYAALAENLNSNFRSYIDEKPMPTNYYIIKAFGVNGQSESSYSTLAQLVDSFPPLKPVMPKASIDTLGNVTLSWEKGPEEDIVGYRVFRSNYLNEEFGQVTGSEFADTIFKEQIKLNNLSRKIYYRLAAMDRNFNQSELSDAVLLLKPDIMPPTSPLFKTVKSKTEGVVLEWINSSSKDAVKHVLYRRQPDIDSWKTVAIFLVIDCVNTYTDNQIQSKILYEYTMLAVDSAKNESEPCKSVFARKIDSGIRPPIENIKTNIDLNNKLIEISWDYPYLDIKQFMVYRSKDENPIQYYKIVSANENSFKDTKLTINTNYKYRLKAVFDDGSESGFSDEINLKY